MTGLVSVTFRKRTAQEIIGLAAAAGLDGIEWGSDVHAPESDPACAALLGKVTRAAGLRVLSYGSYYRLGGGEGRPAAFLPFLKAAAAMDAPNIRIWAGSLPPEKADGAVYEKAAAELREICPLAAREGVAVSLEYHRGTLTQNARSALRLFHAAGCPNLKLYWQPNPELSAKENCAELRQVAPFLSNIHVFHWDARGGRLRLAEGADDWRNYIRAAGGRAGSYLLEFVQNDSEESFLRDARTLRELIAAKEENGGTEEKTCRKG